MSPTLIPDLADRPLPTDSVFFMLRPEPLAARSVHRIAWRLRDKHHLAGSPIEVGRLHLSLCGLGPFGRLTSATLRDIDAAATSLTMPPFLAGFGWIESFRRGNQKRPLVLRGDDTLAGVMMLHDELVAALRRIGFARRNEVFTPHMTLLYDRRDLGEQAVEEIRWMVREIMLVCSLRGRHRHVPLGRWPLQGQA